MADSNIKIVFLGTPEFAVASLRALFKHGYDIGAVVTAPDRPAGRGQKVGISPVKDYALGAGIPVLQPEDPGDAAFLRRLEAIGATLFIVVAFRMLPEAVWAMPPLGTFNLHASLLPQYRGAAPINRCIMNGEKTGGITTFFLKQQVDTGNIIFREETPIGEAETAGEYHDRLKVMGASLVIRTVEAIRKGNVVTRRQEDFMEKGEVLKTAPKIRKEDCRIDWNRPAREIFNQIRGLSPYPGAFTELPLKMGKLSFIKVFRSSVKYCACSQPPGTMMTDHKTFIDVCSNDGCISLLEMQQAGKKRLAVSDFLAGLRADTSGNTL